MRVTIDDSDFVFPAIVRKAKEKFAGRALRLSVVVVGKNVLFWVTTQRKTQTITQKQRTKEEKIERFEKSWIFS